MQKILLLITILAISACANQNDDIMLNNYGPPPMPDTPEYNDGYKYERDVPVQEGEINLLAPSILAPAPEEPTEFDLDVMRVSKELEEAQQEKSKRVYKKLVPTEHDDAFNN